MSRSATTRARERIADLAGAGHDLVTFWTEAAEAVAPAVPCHLTACFYTLDPASLLVTSHYQDGLPEIPAEWLAEEYLGDDFNKIADVARSPRGISTLHEATGGEPERSHRYRTAMREYGAEQESPCGRARATPGAASASTARSAAGPSTTRSSACCGTSRPTWPRAPAGRS